MRLFQDRLDLEIAVLALRRVGEGLFWCERGAHLIGTGDIAHVDRLGRRRDGLGVELVEHLGIFEDVGELLGKERRLLVGEGQFSQLGDM